MLCENEARLVDQDRFKVWPSTVDRAAFKTVMDSDGSSAQIPGSGPLGQAYTVFREKLREYLDGPQGELAERARVLFTVLRDHIQLVVVHIDGGDDPNVIFERLNAHGTPLSPSDLKRNLLLWEAAKLLIDPCQRLLGTALFRFSERGFGFRLLLSSVTSQDGRPRAAILGCFV